MTTTKSNIHNPKTKNEHNIARNKTTERYLSTVSSSSSIVLPNNNRSSNSFGGRRKSNDHEYCIELARRSAARAALHLGIENMSCDALDAIGDALLVYLERMGQSIAKAVESSGRTSAHSNVLDAIRAVERCTAPAAYQVACNYSTVTNTAAADPTKENGAKITSGGDNGGGMMGVGTLDRSWESLATFCFGNDWMELAPNDDLNITSNQHQQQQLQQNGARNNGMPTANGPMINGAISGAAAVKTATAANRNPAASGGGKTAPSFTNGHNHNRPSSTNNNNNNPSAPSTTTNTSDRHGWNAPYLDDVPCFPLLSSSKHPRNFFSNLVGNKLHSLARGEEACCDDAIDDKHVHTTVTKKKDGEEKEKDDEDKEENLAKQRALLAEERAISATKKVPDEFYWGTVSTKIENKAADSAAAASSDKKEDLSEKGKDQDVEMKDVSDDKKTTTDGESEPPTKKMKTDETGGTAGKAGDKKGADSAKADAKKDKDGKKAADKKSDGKDGKGTSKTDSGVNSKKRKVDAKDADNDKSKEGNDKKNKSVSFSTPSPTSKATSRKDDIFGERGVNKRKPSYVPSFFPPFPPERTFIAGGLMVPTVPPGPVIPEAASNAAKAVASVLPVIGRQSQRTRKEADAAQVDSDVARQAVRSSLVHLGSSSNIGSSYWGSGWDTSIDDEKENNVNSTKGGMANISSMRVPSGRPGGVPSGTGKASSAAGAGGDKAKAGAPGISGAKGKTGVSGNAAGGKSAAAASAVNPTVSASVVPLVRESISRTSRILEGSMDAYQ